MWTTDGNASFSYDLSNKIKIVSHNPHFDGFIKTDGHADGQTCGSIKGWIVRC